MAMYQFPDYMLVEIFTRREHLWEYCVYRKGDMVELKGFGLSFPIERLYKNVVFPSASPL